MLAVPSLMKCGLSAAAGPAASTSADSPTARGPTSRDRSRRIGSSFLLSPGLGDDFASGLEPCRITFSQPELEARWPSDARSQPGGPAPHVPASDVGGKQFSGVSHHARSRERCHERDLLIFVRGRCSLASLIPRRPRVAWGLWGGRLLGGKLSSL